MKSERKNRSGLYKSVVDLLSTYDIAKVIQAAILLALGMLLLDYYDIPWQIVFSIPRKIFLIILGAILIIMAVWLLENHFFDLFRITATNPLDMAALVVIIASSVYIPIRYWILGNYVYINIAFWISLFMLVLLVIRCKIRGNKYEEVSKRRSNLIDLKDLYENNISRVPGKPILVQENDVDYDLFDRSEIVGRLYRSIVHCQPESSYVISLEGEWGCGKTTIINNTKRLLKTGKDESKDIVVIDDFDPWLFGSQETLLLAMYETLIQHVGLKYSPSRSNWMVKGIVQTVSENYTAGGVLYNFFHNESKRSDDVLVLKKRISAYLRSCNKRIVFFIDNLDRANDENIIFLFKLISIVFDLPGVVYVLSFERERINSILKTTHEIDQRFTEKIIQQEIKVPAIGEEKVKSVYSICICNILAAYGVTGEEITTLAPVLRYIIDQTRNIRMFKRVLNSVIPSVFGYETILNKSDLLAIEAIHFFDAELYTAIYSNSKLFISHEKASMEAFFAGFRRDDLNKQGAAFFQDLLAQHEESKELLKNMFPYVEKYIESGVLEQEYHFSDQRSAEIAKQSRICSGKYFDLYFSHSSNSYLEIRRQVEKFVLDINNTNSVAGALGVMKKVLRTIAWEDHKEWFEQLQCHMSDILQSKSYYAASSIYALLYEISDEAMFLALAPQSRAEYILADLLSRCNEGEFTEFMEVTRTDYMKLRVIRSVVGWLNGDSFQNNETAKNRSELLLQQCNTMCEQILTGKVNIYSSEYYHKGNAWQLYHYCKDKGDIPRFTAYIMEILSSSTVYRIIWDVSTVAISDNYRYSISEDNMKVFCNDTKVLDDLIQSTKPQNNDEEFVKRVYDAFMNGEADAWGHKGVVTSNCMNLLLL